ncbi:unnamed protein product, partial [Brachionus calyciflorus]
MKIKNYFFELILFLPLLQVKLLEIKSLMYSGLNGKTNDPRTVLLNSLNFGQIKLKCFHMCSFKSYCKYVGIKSGFCSSFISIKAADAQQMDTFYIKTLSDNLIQHVNCTNSEIILDSESMLINNSINLINLNFNYKQICFIRSEAFKNHMLSTSISLSGNSLTVLSSGCLYNLKKLAKLEIGFNKVQFIDYDLLKDVPNLQELDLQGNQ